MGIILLVLEVDLEVVEVALFLLLTLIFWVLQKLSL